ncbi:hypothetical protein, partial [Methanococcoides seepicolus]
MQIKTILIVAMLCLAMVGIAVAPGTPVPEPEEDCCWAKPCGTPVEQCDKETTFVLYESNATIVKTIHGYVYVDMEPDVNGVGQDIITAGDIRLSNWHTNYDPNTKVMPEDMDNLDVIETKYTDPITYVDVNDNQMYDLYDGVVYDLDGDGFVSVGDILQTDLPAVDVYSLDEFDAGEFVMAQGEYGQAWDRVNAAHPAYGMDLALIGNGIASELIKWVDADDSNDWSCEDKLYLIQPHENESRYMDEAVTIGDTRVYIPEGDACIPVCGTKVVQGDHDATYLLMKNLYTAKLAYYSFGGETEWYVDMDGDKFVSFGDIRLTDVSEHYSPNTKVKICDEFDLGHDLVWADQTLVRYVETDGLPGYTLGDAVYVDTDDSDDVSAGDIRLVEVEAYVPGFDDPFVYDAWSVVESNDADVGDELKGIGLGNSYSPLNYYLGYIDSDCTGDWTCPDKLYIQQRTETCDNWGFETGDLSGWNVAAGNVEVLKANNFVPAIPVPQGQYYALLSTGPGTQVPGPGPEDRDGALGNENDIAVLQKTFTASCDTQMTLVYSFLTDEEDQALVFDDIFEITVDGTVVRGSVDQLAGPSSPWPGVPTNDVVYTVVSPGPTDGSFFEDGRSSWNAVNVNLPEGTHTIEIYIGDHGNHVVDSGLLIDVTLAPAILNADAAVTVGDLRLYVPVNDPTSPFFGMEDWPECGTKVTCADIDVEYVVTEVFTNYDFIKFVDRNNNGVFDEGIDHVYIDMDESDDVTLYDVRLTDVSIKDAFYPNNTKVMTQHDLDLGDTLVDADENLKFSDEDLLSVVPYTDTPFTVYMFDNDCSGTWTCVDALYLSIDDQFCQDDYAVTHKDIRLYIPPGLICDGEVPPNGECDYHAYDANQDGMISIGEVSNAIDDYR